MRTDPLRSAYRLKSLWIMRTKQGVSPSYNLQTKMYLILFIVNTMLMNYCVIYKYTLINK